MTITASGHAVGTLTLPQERTAFLIDSLGSGAALARLMDVSRSQPVRWRSGEESPSPGKARQLLDLDHVLARAQLVWTRDVAVDWLNSSNSHLDGARPITVLREEGPARVLQALDAAII